MILKYMKPENLRPYAQNPRKNEAAVPKVAESIRQFGFKVPLVIDSNNVIVAGHTRYKAAQQLGLEYVPCIVADDLTPAQIKAFRLADNKVSELSEWDFAALNAELDALPDFDLSAFGFMAADSIEWDDVPDLTEETYDEPKKKQLKCPECQHIADAKLFAAVKS
jgi:site-specific DNA-methyltransferase (adenine-specific)